MLRDLEQRNTKKPATAGGLEIKTRKNQRVGKWFGLWLLPLIFYAFSLCLANQTAIKPLTTPSVTAIKLTCMQLSNPGGNPRPRVLRVQKSQRSQNPDRLQATKPTARVPHRRRRTDCRNSRPRQTERSSAPQQNRCQKPIAAQKNKPKQVASAKPRKSPSPEN